MRLKSPGVGQGHVGLESLSSNSDDRVTAAMGPQCLVNKPQLFYRDALDTNFLLSLTSLFFAYPKVCPVMMTVAVSECLPMLRLSSVCSCYQEYFFFLKPVSLNYSFHSRASLNETDLDKNTFKVLRIVLEC